jgi:hypothetical protein
VATADTPPKPRRVRAHSPAKPRGIPNKRKPEVYLQKVTICLSLFLFSLLSAGLLGFLVNAPIKPPYDALALQLNPREQCPAVAQDAAAKIDVRESLERDSWYLIPAYTVLFVSLGLALFSSQEPIWVCGLGIVLLIIFAAGSDLLENHYFESCIDGNYIAAGLARQWSLRKWEFVSFATFAAGPPFLARKDWTQALGYLLAATAIPGLLLFIPLNLAYPVVRYVLLPLLLFNLGLLAITFVADLMSPNWFREHWK